LWSKPDLEKTQETPPEKEINQKGLAAWLKRESTCIAGGPELKPQYHKKIKTR
jgi:hypothetical protein